MNDKSTLQSTFIFLSHHYIPVTTLPLVEAYIFALPPTQSSCQDFFFLSLSLAALKMKPPAPMRQNICKFRASVIIGVFNRDCDEEKQSFSSGALYRPQPCLWVAAARTGLYGIHTGTTQGQSVHPRAAG